MFVGKIISSSILLAVGLLLFLLLIEFMVGCGEKKYHKDRTWETNACVFLPHKVKAGTW